MFARSFTIWRMFQKCKICSFRREQMIHKFLLDTPLTCKVRMRKNLIFCSQNFRNNGEVKCGNKMALQQQQNKKILQKCHKNQQSIQAISMAPASFALCQLDCYISISIFKSHLSPNPKLYIGVRISVANQKLCFWDDTIVEQFFSSLSVSTLNYWGMFLET